jgi:hypothetical protein
VGMSVHTFCVSGGANLIFSPIGSSFKSVTREGVFLC